MVSKEVCLRRDQINKAHMGAAQGYSFLSRAKRKKVGAVIVKAGSIISIGWNGTPAGFDNECEDELGNTKEEVLHAELNCISKLAASTQSSFGASLYTTLAPCLECAKLIIQSGILEVFYIEEYRNENGIILLKKANIDVSKIELQECK